MLVQFAFFSSYFLFSMPSGKIVEWIGYKRSMVTGLLTMATGALMFVPAASIPSFPVVSDSADCAGRGHDHPADFRQSVCGYSWSAPTASSRLNLTQAFNSLGTTLAPRFGSWLILGAAFAPASIEVMRAMSADQLHSLPHTAGCVRESAVHRVVAGVDCSGRDCGWLSCRSSNMLKRMASYRQHLASSAARAGRGGDFRLRRRGSRHRQPDDQLFQPEGNWRSLIKRRGRLPAILLGRRDGRAVCRSALLQRASARDAAGVQCDGCCSAGRAFPCSPSAISPCGA